MANIRRISLPIEGFPELAGDARGEGYAFVDRLDAEWRSGENRFAAPGELLLGAFEVDRLVAVGGLNRDPFIDAPRIGRLRHLYVRPAWRRRGIGGVLVAALLREARGRFDRVRLRTHNPAAARFYQGVGFQAVEEDAATHCLIFAD